MEELFGEEVKSKFPKFISHSSLVKVTSGDGIGFDTGECVAVTTAKNNVLTLIKKNYRTEFKEHESLAVSRKEVRHVSGLVPGHTYIVCNDDMYAFTKYLGDSMVLVICSQSCEIVKLKSKFIPPHYELSIPIKTNQ